MSENILIAIVGFVAAIFGSMVTHGLQWWRDREDKKIVELKERRKIGAEVTNSLDKFSVDCAIMIFKNDFDNSEYPVYSPSLKIPELPNFVNESSVSILDPSQYSDLLSLVTHRYVGEFQIDQGLQLVDGDVALDEANRQLKRLALLARNLASEIRTSLDLPNPEFDDKYLSISKVVWQPTEETT